MHTIVGLKLDLCNIFPFCISCSWQSENVHDMYVHGIYMVWTCMYTNIHTNICMLVYIHCLNIVWMKYMHLLLYIRVCTWDIHGIDLAVHMIHMSVRISSLFITRTWSTILSYQYCLDVYNFVLACTALVMCRYYAIVQEYDFLYVLCSDWYIPLKNGQGRWSAFM